MQEPLQRGGAARLGRAPLRFPSVACAMRERNAAAPRERSTVVRQLVEMLQGRVDGAQRCASVAERRRIVTDAAGGVVLGWRAG